MILLKISTFYDVDNHKKPSWIKGQIACHCNIIFICSFQNKVFSDNTSFLNISAVHSVHSTVLSLAFTPSRFEAHGSSLYSKWHSMLSCLVGWLVSGAPTSHDSSPLINLAPLIRHHSLIRHHLLVQYLYLV